MLYSQTSRGRAQPLEYLSNAGPHSSRTKSRSPTQNSIDATHNNKRQVLSSTSMSGIQATSGGGYSSGEEEEENFSDQDENDLSVRSTDKKQQKSPRAGGKPPAAAGTSTTTIKPQPPTKSSSSKQGKKGPQRINFLSALKHNPVLQTKRQEQNERAQHEVSNMEDAERQDIEVEEQEEFDHLYHIEHEENPDVLRADMGLKRV